jgi:serine/threonine protein kinase
MSTASETTRIDSGAIIRPTGLAREVAPMAHAALTPPALCAGYTLLAPIGRGGMGDVYEAVHGSLGRPCVVKMLRHQHHDRQDFAARLREEARILAQLCHRNLVDVFDLGTMSDGRPFFAMELLRGRDLRRELALVGAMPARMALDVVIQALDGLEAAHDAGVIHRDVKLENLFLCVDGTVKLIDFGIAKVSGSDLGLSQGNVAMGTPRTMSPEQYALRAVDTRADLYAMGLVLYELVAGRGPFDELRANPQALRFAHCRRTPPPPSMFAREPVAPGIEAAILHAIAKDPDDRFQSAREMADALRALAGERRRRRSHPPEPGGDGDATPVDGSTIAAESPARGAAAAPMHAPMAVTAGGRRALRRLTRHVAPTIAIVLSTAAVGIALARAPSGAAGYDGASECAHDGR